MQSNDQAGAWRFDNDIDWNLKMDKEEYQETHGSRNKHTLPPEFTLKEAYGIIHELREDVARHEQMLERIITFLQQKEDNSAPPPAWMPSRVMGGVIEHSPAAIKIRKVKPLNRDDIVTELHNTWLGRVYRSHLKHYSAVRWLVQWIWRNGYPVYVNHVAIRLSNWKKKRWRPLTKLSEFTKKSGIQTYKLADAVFVETPKPKVFPACDQDYLVSPHDQYEFPEIFVAIINKAVTYGGTNLVLVDNEVVCHDLYDFKRDYTSEELHGRTLIDPKSGRIRWLLHDEAPEPIPVAATFVDACAPNYAHWMTEVMPRVVLFCAEERFKDVPIVVNEGLHKNIMESLFLVAGADREIITLPIGRALAVNELYLTSVVGYVPFERRTNKISGHSHGIFSPNAFQILRNHLNALRQKTDEEAWPEKIFIRRSSSVRNLINCAEIEELLISRGFVTVEPEKLTFSQQVRLFSCAKVIVGATGAAFANAVFCENNPHLAIIMSNHKDMLFGYWRNMLSHIPNDISYILGDFSKNNTHGVHSDFVVDPLVMEDFLANI